MSDEEQKLPSGEIEEALNEIRSSCPDNEVTFEPAANGGFYIFVNDLLIGDQYEPSVAWIGFHLPENYPDPDVYPHHLPSNVKRKNGKALGESFSTTEWAGRQVIQVSRRTNDWNGAVDTAHGKLVKVLAWIRGRP